MNYIHTLVLGGLITLCLLVVMVLYKEFLINNFVYFREWYDHKFTYNVPSPKHISLLETMQFATIVSFGDDKRQVMPLLAFIEYILLIIRLSSHA